MPNRGKVEHLPQTFPLCSLPTDRRTQLCGLPTQLFKKQDLNETVNYLSTKVKCSFTCKQQDFNVYLCMCI